MDQVGGYAPLHDEVFDEVAHLVVDERRDHGRLKPEAFPQAAGHVVFAPTLPGLELPSRADPPFTRIEAEHDLTERDLVEGTGTGGFEG